MLGTIIVLVLIVFAVTHLAGGVHGHRTPPSGWA